MPDSPSPKVSSDHMTTAAGGVSGIALLASVDYAKLSAGDTAEIAKAIAGLALIVLGYFSNKTRAV